jgi:hypothetical protein
MSGASTGPCLRPPLLGGSFALGPARDLPRLRLSFTGDS